MMADLSTSMKKDSKKQKLKESKEPSFCTNEEDRILMEKAQEYHFKNWNAIANFIPGRTSIQCSARYRRIRPGLIKGAWGKEEDEKLLMLHEKYGKNWAAISKEMPHRTGKQIRDRFLNSLDTKFERGKFTEEEDQTIIKYYKLYGNSWAKIAKKLKTRTGDMVKNRFYSSLKKSIFKNKNFLRRKRVYFSPNKYKERQIEKKNEETHKNESPFEIQKEKVKIENKVNDKVEEEKDVSDHIDNLNDSIIENNDRVPEKNDINLIENNFNNFSNDFERKNPNHIIIKNDSIDDSLNYSENLDKMLDDNCVNDNRIKNIINNYEFYDLDENIKKNEINHEQEYIDNNYNHNTDLFAIFGNNVNNNNFLNIYNRDDMDERLEKFKKGPKLELDYKQNLKEQLGIIFNLENIINQKLFSVQQQLENN